MSKEDSKKEKVCLKCRKKLVISDGLLCKKCQLNIKDSGKKIGEGVLAVLVLTGSAIYGASKNKKDSN